MVFFIWIDATSGFLKRIPQEKPHGSFITHHFEPYEASCVSQLKSINFIGEGADPSNYSQAPRYWKWWSLLSCWDPQRWKQKIEWPLKRLEFYWSSGRKIWFKPTNLNSSLGGKTYPLRKSLSFRFFPKVGYFFPVPMGGYAMPFLAANVCVCVPTRGLCGTCGQARVIRVEETWWVEEFEQNSCFASEIPGVATVNRSEDPTWKL